MKKRHWTSQKKTQIIFLEGLSGKMDISKLCNKYQINQTQYYKWRDLFLKQCHTAFDVKNSLKKSSTFKPKSKN